MGSSKTTPKLGEPTHVTGRVDYGDGAPLVDFEEQFLVVSGHKVCYVDVGPRDAPVLLLIHGIGSSWRAWEPVLPLLSKSFRCVAVDLPGFGKSDRPQGLLKVEKIVAILKAFQQELEIPLVVVCGHSMGALAATHLAIASPDTCSGLVLVSGHLMTALSLYGHPIRVLRQGPLTGLLFVAQVLTLATPWPLRVRRAALNTRWTRNLILGKFVADPDAFSPEQLDRIAARMNNRSVIAVMVNGIGYSYEETLRTIPIGVHIVAGAADQLAPLSDLDLLRKVRPDASVTVVENVGHWMHLEAPGTAAKVVSDAARAFIEG